MIGYWNRIVLEIVQAQPSGLQIGNYSGRILVNGTAPNRTYFGDLTTTPKLFDEMSQATIDLCSGNINGETTLNQSTYGSSEILNFLWLDGNQSVFLGNSSMSLSFIEILVNLFLQ